MKGKELLFQIPCCITELNLDITLQCGQAFRWIKNTDNKWTGMIKSNLWTLHQDNTFIYCMLHNPTSLTTSSEKVKDKTKSNKYVKDCKIEKEMIEHISNYFRLEICLKDLYAEWSDKDSNFEKISKSFPGVRMLNQPPVENVFSFICSSNNNIVRISQLVEKLCRTFGDKVATLDGKDWYSFPAVESLTDDKVEGKLRELGFGYRAPYIQKSALMISERGGEKWLESLKLLPREECRKTLCQLPGVGPKVSDCICLMSMNHLSSIPVDTHVYQIAVRDYQLQGLVNTKTVTDRVYRAVADHFMGLYGPYAGWAHSVLFSADLKKFSSPEKKVESKPKKRKMK